jgi:hypothetical protein
MRLETKQYVMEDHAPASFQFNKQYSLIKTAGRLTVVTV